MKRIFRREPLIRFGTAGQCSRRSSKIGFAAGFMLIFLSFQQSGFSQNLNNFKLGSEPAGFGQIYWGIDVMTLGNFEYSRKDPSYGGIDIYRKPGDDSCICGVPSKNIEYLFWKGRFCGVIFFKEGFSGYEHFRGAVSKEYGEGNKPFRDQEYYVWEGKKTLMALEYNAIKKKILFWMFSVAILRQMEQPDK
jgi:hypothetical protein